MNGTKKTIPTIHGIDDCCPWDASFDIFETPIGWFGIRCQGDVILGIKFGFKTASDVESSFENDLIVVRSTERFSHHWRNVCREYAEGQQVSFSHLKIDLSWMTPFQKQVVCACREIPYGSTMTYGQLATVAGSPGAARAVGTVMRRNRFPIVVPCHRVVGANGIGGYSASQGVKTKLQLLTMETRLQRKFPCDHRLNNEGQRRLILGVASGGSRE